MMAMTDVPKVGGIPGVLFSSSQLGSPPCFHSFQNFNLKTDDISELCTFKKYEM